MHGGCGSPRTGVATLPLRVLAPAFRDSGSRSLPQRSVANGRCAERGDPVDSAHERNTTSRPPDRRLRGNGGVDRRRTSGADCHDPRPRRGVARARASRLLSRVVRRPRGGEPPDRSGTLRARFADDAKPRERSGRRCGRADAGRQRGIGRPDQPRLLDALDGAGVSADADVARDQARDPTQRLRAATRLLRPLRSGSGRPGRPSLRGPRPLRRRFPWSPTRSRRRGPSSFRAER